MSLFLALLVVLESFTIPVKAETGKNADAGGGNEAFLCGYQDIDFGFTEEELALPQETAPQSGIATYSLWDEPAAETADPLPSVYGGEKGEEAKSALPALRNQGYGNCWAFSAIGTCEATLIHKGLATNAIDLSERHLSYYFYYKGEDTADPLGGTLGDHNTNISSENYLNIGGNSMLTIWHLASWCGPVDDALVPYSGLTGETVDIGGLMGQENSTAMAYESDAYHLQNAYIIPIGKSYQDEAQRNTVKRLIMQYGALGMSYYSQKSGNDFDNAEFDCYYNDTYTSTNHAIMVVGWDDNFSKEKFNKNRQPDGDGAWLMRNSHGAESKTKAQNGYFWLSYYDYSLRDATGSTTKYAYVYDCEPADNYDHIYQYDGDAGYYRIGHYAETNGSRTYSRDAISSGANVYTARGKDGGRERLDAVGIGVSSVGAGYTLRIYLDPPEDDPTGGTLACEQSGSIPYNGFHTIRLDEPVLLDNGQKFAVVFFFPDTAFVYASMTFNASNTWAFHASNTAGQSFARKESGEWTDCAQGDIFEPCALRIKAYTTDAGSVSGNTVSGNENPTPKPTKEPTAAPTAEPTEKPTAAPTIKPTAEPTAKPTPVPTAAPTGGNGGASVVPAKLTGLKLSQKKITLETASEYELVATPAYDRPAATDWMVYWKSSDETVASVSDCGRVKAKRPGTAVITVYNGAVEASCIVQVVPGQADLSGATVSREKLTFNVTRQNAVDGYVLYRATKENGSYKKVKQLSQNAGRKITVPAHKGSTPYYYKVRAYKVVDGRKVYGAFSEAATAAPPKARITGAVSAKKCTVTVKWAKTARSSGYVLFRSTKKNSGYKKVGTVSGGGKLRLSDGKLKKGNVYYYKVAAYRMIGKYKVTGSMSEPVKVRVTAGGSVKKES